MNPIVDLSRVTPTEMMTGEDEEDSAKLKEMFRRSEAYINHFKWCPPIAASFFGFGIGGVVAAFLFQFESKADGTDDLLWVIEGDLPSAYLVADDAPDATGALSVYCDLMEAWAKAVLDGTSRDHVFPVEAPATPESAMALLSRTRFLREKVIPVCKERLSRNER